MTLPLWVADAADAFWRAAGEVEPFPRDLRRAIAFALPLGVVSLPRLRLRGVDDWLRGEGIDCRLAPADRALRACLVARRGQGLIFLDGTDPPDEQRFSLAHELAHFVRDYWLPRRQAGDRLGPAVLEVLDGARPPRPEERVQAVLARVELGYHVHLLDRAPDGAPGPAVASAERAADLLACALLAPAADALRDLPALPAPARREAVARRLAAEFGLPAAPAARYAATLVPPPAGGDDLLRRLGFAR
ncbi:MAG TPA: ImmA/IrrE family metallo-endopeptidase [Thermomicrobiales bacterium]|nr:ImmA/IrrE family metallo-endopeptidase [Thermomicrobiales bacterium]